MRRQVFVHNNEPIPAGETKEDVWPLGLDLFDGADQAFYDTNPAELVFTVEINHVVFADGASIKVAESLEEAKTFPPSAPQRASPSSSYANSSPDAL